MSDRDTVAKVMRETRIAILTYEDDAGRLVSTPMGTQDFEDPSTVWFITEADSDKVAAITARPRVNVAYASDAGWVSLSGTAALNRDRAKLDELWDVSATAFMSGATESSVSKMMASHGSVFAFSRALSFAPGMYSTERRGLITSVIVRSFRSRRSRRARGRGRTASWPG